MNTLKHAKAGPALDQFIADLRKRLQELLEHSDDLDCEIAKVSDQLQMAESVLNDLNRHFGLPAISNIDEHLRKRFEKRPIRDMLVELALEADGVLDISEARKTLVKAGVFKDERNATTSMVPILSREDTFRRIGRGIYLLLKKPAAQETAPYLVTRVDLDKSARVAIGDHSPVTRYSIESFPDYAYSIREPLSLSSKNILPTLPERSAVVWTTTQPRGRRGISAGARLECP